MRRGTGVRGGREGEKEGRERKRQGRKGKEKGREGEGNLVPTVISKSRRLRLR